MLKGVISYWIFPVFSALTWLGMLLGMLLFWAVHLDTRPFPTMVNSGAKIAYISDIGAFQMKPLFIAMGTVTVVTLDISFAAERWLRHRGRLVPNQSKGEKILFAMTIIFALVGTVGLISLTNLDNYRHDTLHNVFLLLFIGGYWISAVFICAEYQRLGIKNRDHRILRISFWVKLFFILVELFLAIAFVSLRWTNYRNAAAIVEWVIAFVFTLYVISFAIDLWPAVQTKDHSQRFVKPREMTDEEHSPTPEQWRPAAQNAHF